jgi:hypothetical protein
MSDPTPDLREQAVEAAGRAIASLVPPKRHGQLCPVWTQHAKHPAITTCDCWVLPNARTDAEVALAAVLPVIERAALDRAERALRGAAALPGDGPDAAVTREVLAAAADLVASLRDGD